MPLPVELLYNDEKELLSLLSKGDEQALKFIYHKYWERLFISAYNILKDKEASEDIVQEIFIQLWRKREQLVITSSFEGYLFTATRYQVFHAIKKLKDRQHLFQQLEERLSSNGPEDLLQAKNIQQTITTAVEGLPEKCKDIYKLSREHHLSYKQIASHLNISQKTVENQLAIALKRLRTVLSNLGSLFL